MYRGRIRVVRILRYVSWSIGCVSHANRNRTFVGYVSDTGYVGNEMNLGNPASKGKEKYSKRKILSFLSAVLYILRVLCFASESPKHLHPCLVMKYDPFLLFHVCALSLQVLVQ
jgi:hypothetical protein